MRADEPSPHPASVTLLCLVLLCGFGLASIGAVALQWASRPLPPSIPYTEYQARYYERQLEKTYASLVLSLGVFVIVGGLVVGGIAIHTLDSKVRGGAVIGAGLLLIGFALLVVRPVGLLTGPGG